MKRSGHARVIEIYKREIFLDMEVIGLAKQISSSRNPGNVFLNGRFET